MDQIRVRVNTGIHGSLLRKQTLNIHKRHPMLRKIPVVLKKKKMMRHAIILAGVVPLCDIISQ